MACRSKRVARRVLIVILSDFEVCAADSNTLSLCHDSCDAAALLQCVWVGREPWLNMSRLLPQMLRG